MNREQFEGKWHQFKGKIKEKWGKLTDNDLAQINGKYDQFLGALQKHYGYKREQAEKEFNQWNWGNQAGGHAMGHQGEKKHGDWEHGKTDGRAMGNQGEKKHGNWEQGKKGGEHHEKKRKAG